MWVTDQAIFLAKNGMVWSVLVEVETNGGLGLPIGLGNFGAVGFAIYPQIHIAEIGHRHRVGNVGQFKGEGQFVVKGHVSCAPCCWLDHKGA